MRSPLFEETLTLSVVPISGGIPFARITQARTVVDFRNQLTHGYMTVNDKLVWAYAVRNAPLLRDECATLLAEMDAGAAD